MVIRAPGLSSETMAIIGDQPVRARIAGISNLTEANEDVIAYDIRVAVDGGGEVPICGYNNDGSAKQALLVPGTWDYATGDWLRNDGLMSVACRKGTIAKCVELGYKPWNGLGDHLQSCVRMLRADYCGDGTPHTITGTMVNLYDNVGVQEDTYGWPVDGEWGPQGALCFNNHRGVGMPSCANKKLETCGSFSRAGALIINEYNGPVID
jgi:hypothetical protein